MKTTVEVTFVKEDEKENALKSRNIEIPKGAECKICGKGVSVGNLGMVIPAKDGYDFVCSDKKCMLLAKIEVS